MKNRQVHQFTVYGRLPSLNEVLDTAKGPVGQRAYSAKKRELNDRVALEIKLQLRGVKINYGFCLQLVWFRRTNQGDDDNVFSALKFVLDGMVHAGLIPDDSRRYFNGGALQLREICPEAKGENGERVEVTIIEGQLKRIL